MSLDALRAELDGTADLPLEEAVPRIATALNGQGCGETGISFSHPSPRAQHSVCRKN